MKLVKNDQADTGELRILLQAPRQDPFGQYLDAGTL